MRLHSNRWGNIWPISCRSETAPKFFHHNEDEKEIEEEGEECEATGKKKQNKSIKLIKHFSSPNGKKNTMNRSSGTVLSNKNFLNGARKEAAKKKS